MIKIAITLMPKADFVERIERFFDENAEAFGELGTIIAIEFEELSPE